MKKKEYSVTRRHLILSLIHILIFSTVLSFILSNIFIFRTIADRFNNSIDIIADNITSLSESNITPDEIVKITSTPIYPVKLVDGISRYSLTDEEYGEFIQKGIVKFKASTLYNSVLLKQNGAIYEISVNASANDFITNLLSVGLAMLIAFLISVIVAIAAVNTMLKPIRDLSEAALQISKGDFSVRVKRSSNPELDKLAENFNIMAEELDKMETLSNDFVRNVSHEFKTPVTSLCGFAELLKQSDLTPQQKDYADIIDSEARRLSKLTSNILSLSKLENQNIVTEKTKFFIDEQLRQCILLLEKKWTEKKINIEIYLDKSEYYGNKLLTEHIWINLLDNAIKYTPDGGEIIVSCTTDSKNNIIVSVKDNGIGMSQEVKERIFDKFYQGDRSHSQEGNGLGLAITKRIVDICGGTIEVDSHSGEGSVFVVTLPTEQTGKSEN